MVITRTTRNRFAFTGTWVRIQPSPFVERKWRISMNLWTSAIFITKKIFFLQGFIRFCRVIYKRSPFRHFLYQKCKEETSMKKMILCLAAGILSLSLTFAGCPSTQARAKTVGRRCSFTRGCRVTGKHHSKKRCVKYVKKHHYKIHHKGHHGGHHR